MKTSELEGEQLNYAVALAEGMNVKGVLYTWNGRTKLKVQTGEAPCEYQEMTFNYAYDWSQGGEIIEREQLDVVYRPDYSDWASCKFDRDKPKQHLQTGETPLIAAMRCYVAMKLGDEVKTPEELLDSAHG